MSRLRALAAYLLPDDHLGIDVCTRCRGAKVEHDAFSKIVKPAEIKSALDRINAERNCKTSMFQSLAGFPGDNMRVRAMGSTIEFA